MTPLLFLLILAFQLPLVSPYDNPNYNYNYQLSARDCLSGCCASTGPCAQTLSQCYYQYGDFGSNASYYFPGAYHYLCSSTGRDCTSGCCTTSGSCSNTVFTCVYPYNDFYSNPNYYFPSDTTPPVYNASCLSTARSCVSGCCNYSGFCAVTLATCFYRYRDFYTNTSYYFSNNSTINSTNTTNTTNNTYRNYDYTIQLERYYNQLYCRVGSECYKAKEDAQNRVIGTYVGGYGGYLALFVIGIVVLYCRKKPWVQWVNAFDTENPSLSPSPDNNLNQTSAILNPHIPQPVIHYSNQYNGNVTPSQQQVVYGVQHHVEPGYTYVKG